MGILSEIYLSRNDSEAVSYDTVPESFADRAEFKHFTPLELSMLWSLTRGVGWDPAMLDAFPCLLCVDGGERLIHRFPAEMIPELAALPPDRIPPISAAWAATEEMSCPPDDAEEIITEVSRLARLAVETGRSLYIWNCV